MKQQRIWKWELEITDLQTIAVPRDPSFLSVQFQSGTLCLWALVDPDEPKRKYAIRIIGTGNPISDPPLSANRFIGTVQQFNGELVWHVFWEATI